MEQNIWSFGKNASECCQGFLKKRFEDKPVLHNLLTNGEVSINKLARVVSIATVENEEELADKVRILPNRALEQFVRDEKIAQVESAIPRTVDRNSDGSQKLLIPLNDLHVQIKVNPKIHELKLDNEIINELYELQQKGISIN